MFKLLLYGLLIWFLYNLVFRFIIPVYRTSSQLRKKFREMNEKMDQHQQGYQEQPTPEAGAKARPNTSAPARKGDYLDFEEIK